MADRQVTLTLTRNNYKRDLTFLVAPIKHDLILGTPWLESIRVTNELQRDTKWIASIPLSRLDNMDILDFENAEHTPFRGTYEFLASPSVPPDIHIAYPVLQPLLTRYDSIIQEPTDLPPSRPDDHRITYPIVYNIPIGYVTDGTVKQMTFLSKAKGTKKAQVIVFGFQVEEKAVFKSKVVLETPSSSQ